MSGDGYVPPHRGRRWARWSGAPVPRWPGSTIPVCSARCSGICGRRSHHRAAGPLRRRTQPTASGADRHRGPLAHGGRPRPICQCGRSTGTSPTTTSSADMASAAPTNHRTASSISATSPTRGPSATRRDGVRGAAPRGAAARRGTAVDRRLPPGTAVCATARSPPCGRWWCCARPPWWSAAISRPPSTPTTKYASGALEFEWRIFERAVSVPVTS